MGLLLLLTFLVMSPAAQEVEAKRVASLHRPADSRPRLTVGLALTLHLAAHYKEFIKEEKHMEKRGGFSRPLSRQLLRMRLPGCVYTELE